VGKITVLCNPRHRAAPDPNDTVFGKPRHVRPGRL